MPPPSTFETNVNTARYTSGFSSDQIAPSTEAAYFTFSSLRTRFSRISRCATRRRKRSPTLRCGESEVRSTVVWRVAAITRGWAGHGAPPEHRESTGVPGPDRGDAVTFASL